MSLHDIELEILQLLALVIGSMVVLALQRFLSFLHVKMTADRQALLAATVDKVMTLGVVKADDEIRAKGWDHPDVKNAVVGFAIDRIGTAFSDTLGKLDINLSDPATRIGLMNMMERMWPDVAARAAASPATPQTGAAPTISAVEVKAPAA